MLDGIWLVAVGFVGLGGLGTGIDSLLEAVHAPLQAAKHLDNGVG